MKSAGNLINKQLFYIFINLIVLAQLSHICWISCYKTAVMLERVKSKFNGFLFHINSSVRRSRVENLCASTKMFNFWLPVY